MLGVHQIMLNWCLTGMSRHGNVISSRPTETGVSMSRFTPGELKQALGAGLLSFPVTHASPDCSLDVTGFQEHVSWLATHNPAGLFVAGGTGEFFAVPRDEIAPLTRAAVEVSPDELPIVGPAGYGTADAVEMAKQAEAAGADGVFLLPPYLTEVSQAGLVEHVQAVCAATNLGVIVYHRANAKFSLEAVQQIAAACPNFIGFKDGIGDIELMTRLYATLEDRLLYIGGLPTAELYALPYLEMGVTTYSSAIFNFAPRWANDFYSAVRKRDADTVYEGLRQFVMPYMNIRNRTPGYAVSIVKAGLQVIGRPAGPVRLPLTDLTPADFTELTPLIEQITEKELVVA